MLWLVVVLEVSVFLFSFSFSCIIFILPRNPYSISHYLGLGGLIILTLLYVLCWRKRRKNDFDGNFDFIHVNLNGRSGTLPKIDLGEDGLMGNNGVEVDEDDGMGGRLGAGPGCGGIISPYPLQLAPVTGTTNGGLKHQNKP